MPLKTTFLENKITRQINSESTWPCLSKINGFEIHNGVTELLEKRKNIFKMKPIFKDLALGWYKENSNGGTIAGTYIHGIFENDLWRINYLNLIRDKKGIKILDKKYTPFRIKREAIIDNLANQFKKHINITSLLN